VVSFDMFYANMYVFILRMNMYVFILPIDTYCFILIINMYVLILSLYVCAHTPLVGTRIYSLVQDRMLRENMKRKPFHQSCTDNGRVCNAPFLNGMYIYSFVKQVYTYILIPPKYSYILSLRNMYILIMLGCI
jgi:hypothetical protein